MKPIIGIATSEINDELDVLQNTKIAYTPIDTIKGIKEAGGLPFLLPVSDTQLAKLYAAKIDGLVLSGGHDVSPLFYGEEPTPELGATLPTRDEFEISLVQEMLALKKPIFAICRGLQIVNVATGGTLYQDINILEKNTIKHRQETNPKYASHSISTEENSIVRKILGEKTTVNTLHHQAVKTLGHNLKITAKSPDGFIEAVESSINEQYILALQWHPEILLQNNDIQSQNLFNNFVEHVKKYKEK
ncbi:gamma-glutamyl-gamma-aminobutyrate hydrolase family protein [Gemelliphila palaticanis]|uniref:Gamma-glutamyl-gamma-aminobutyrate hydrolase family protein n=1 Tax=Gemelliphila palaticanis TaxID=81950 RepID=A0ABX2SY67_9BACL|nr:gamma-glutamyl-gamma-aminobutyrate hydrolase family protein [Gemella palaticanis]MBF0714811.1 gamma-glutamyl-gamma-aminobutyrate hydrolase family protein [Gemella palaticanis]NYS46741.1 gamma-glutamyl-gamma-aminobutyrate hydrolase family protein [Gemella palaticanis]